MESLLNTARIEEARHYVCHLHKIMILYTHCVTTKLSYENLKTSLFGVVVLQAKPLLHLATCSLAVVFGSRQTLVPLGHLT